MMIADTSRTLRSAALPVLLAGAIAGLGSCSNQAVPIAPEPQEETIMPVDLVIYSPAPARIMLHAHNVEMGAALQACGAFGAVETPPVALPDSINQINELPADQRPYHLPIVTTLDFRPARMATAPDWHAYPRANPDLRFVASLYDVAFGVLTFDPSIQGPTDLVGKRIGVPPRPSSVRWFSEALLRDGWGIVEQVELVDILPPDVPAALAEGRIDATTWNIMSETPDGFLPLIPPLMDRENAHFLDIAPATRDAINQAAPFRTELVSIAPGRIRSSSAGPVQPVSLLSFRQALAAWDDTPDTVVTSILSCLSEATLSYGSGRGFAADRLNWPDLTQDEIHPAARKFGKPD